MKGKRILIVDDEPFVLETLKFSLEQSGFDCLTASSAGEAVEMAREEVPDLILLDVGLPDLDGYKVCRLLKTDEACRHIPVVMLAPRNVCGDEEAFTRAGAAGCIAKPFDPGRLIETVRGYLTGEGEEVT